MSDNEPTGHEAIPAAYSHLNGGKLDRALQRQLLEFLDAVALQWRRRPPSRELVGELLALKSALLRVGRRGQFPMKQERLWSLFDFMHSEIERGTSRTGAAEIAAEKFHLSQRRVLQLFPEITGELRRRPAMEAPAAEGGRPQEKQIAPFAS